MALEVDRRNLPEAEAFAAETLGLEVAVFSPAGEVRGATVERRNAYTGSPAVVACSECLVDDGTLIESARDLASSVIRDGAESPDFIPSPQVQETSSGERIVHLYQHVHGIPVFQAARLVRFSRNGKVDIIDLGNRCCRGSLGGDGPGDRDRHFLDSLFYDRRFGIRRGDRLIDLEPVDFRQNVNRCGLLAGPRSRRYALRLRQGPVEAGSKRVSALRSCDLRHAPFSSRHEIPVTFNVFNREVLRVPRDERLNSPSCIFLALRIKKLRESGEGNPDRRVGRHEHASRQDQTHNLLRQFPLALVTGELQGRLKLLLDHVASFPMKSCF